MPYFKQRQFALSYLDGYKESVISGEPCTRSVALSGCRGGEGERHRGGDAREGGSWETLTLADGLRIQLSGLGRSWKPKLTAKTAWVFHLSP